MKKSNLPEAPLKKIFLKYLMPSVGAAPVTSIFLWEWEYRESE